MIQLCTYGACAAHRDACSPRTTLSHKTCPLHVPRVARAPAASRGVSLRWRVRGHLVATPIPVRGARRSATPRTLRPRYSTTASPAIYHEYRYAAYYSNQYAARYDIVYLAWRCAQTELGVHLGDAQPGADELREEVRIDRRRGRRSPWRSMPRTFRDKRS